MSALTDAVAALTAEVAVLTAGGGTAALQQQVNDLTAQTAALQTENDQASQQIADATAALTALNPA